MKVLLKFDADPNLANDKGITSIDICKDNKILKLLAATEVDVEKSHMGSREKEDGGEAKREEEPEKCPEVEIKTGAESTPPPSSPKTETDDVSDMDTEQVFHQTKQEVTMTSNSGPLNLENVPPSAGTSGTTVGRKGARGRPRGRRTKGGFYSDISSSESESDYFEAGSKRRRRKELLVERQTQRPLEGVSESQEETDEDVEMGIGVREEGMGEEGKGEEGKDKVEKSEKMEGVGMVVEGTGKDEQGSIVKEKNEAEKEEKEGEKDEEKEGEKDEEKEEEEKTLDEHHEIGTVKSDSGQEPELKKEPEETKEMEGSSETPSSRLFYCVWIHCVYYHVALLVLCAQVLFQRGETMG